MSVELTIVRSIRELVTSSDNTPTRLDSSVGIRASALLVVGFPLNSTRADMPSTGYIKGLHEAGQPSPGIFQPTSSLWDSDRIRFPPQ
jgi:hypothetical protein